MRALPLSLAAVTIYCGGFLAYTAIGVRRAPRAAKQQAFIEQFDYIVSDVRPNCYWWGLVDLSYSFALAVVQALTAPRGFSSGPGSRFGTARRRERVSSEISLRNRRSELGLGSSHSLGSAFLFEMPTAHCWRARRHA